MQELIKASTATDGVLLLTLNRPEKRKTLVNDIFKFKIPIGKSKKEICELFGYEPHMYTSMTWSYPVESGKLS